MCSFIYIPPPPKKSKLNKRWFRPLWFFCSHGGFWHFYTKSYKKVGAGMPQDKPTHIILKIRFCTSNKSAEFAVTRKTRNRIQKIILNSRRMKGALRRSKKIKNCFHFAKPHTPVLW